MKLRLSTLVLGALMGALFSPVLPPVESSENGQNTQTDPVIIIHSTSYFFIPAPISESDQDYQSSSDASDGDVSFLHLFMRFVSPSTRDLQYHVERSPSNISK